MTITEQILNGIRRTVETGDKVTINLREASGVTGSGSGIGGRTFFDDAFAAYRYANPFRQGARQTSMPNMSDVTFVAKTGSGADSSNPWGYTVSANAGDIDTAIWQLPTRVISAQVPIRTAVLSDVNGLETEIIDDLMLEFAALEGASMGLNDDQAGSATTATGGTDGLRGLNSYAGASGDASAFGTSGTAITDGIHQIATVGATVAGVNKESLSAMRKALPGQYWSLPGTAWMMHPSAIDALTKSKTAGNVPFFVETGDADGGALLHVFGWPVIPNPYLDTWDGVGKISVYLANWPRFMQIVDVEEMSVQAMEQTAPGFVTLYAEKRMVSTVRDPFAGVRLIATA